LQKFGSRRAICAGVIFSHIAGKKRLDNPMHGAMCGDPPGLLIAFIPIPLNEGKTAHGAYF
jgi:hypothetical protein